MNFHYIKGPFIWLLFNLNIRCVFLKKHIILSKFDFKIFLKNTVNLVWNTYTYVYKFM